MNIDPARQGVNWYTYCANNPLKYVDPDGKFTSLLGIGGNLLLDAGFYLSRRANNRTHTQASADLKIFRKVKRALDKVATGMVITAGGTGVTAGSVGAGIGLTGASGGAGAGISIVIIKGGVVLGVVMITGGGAMVITGTQELQQALAELSTGSSDGGNNQNSGFAKQVKNYSDKGLSSAENKFMKRINEHIQKIQDDPTNEAVNHWEHEIRVFRSQLEIIQQEILNRGL